MSRNEKIWLIVLAYAIAIIVGMSIGVIASATEIVRDRTIEVGREGVDNNAITRFDDPVFKVKCWVLRDGHGGGLSCMPWSEVEQR